MNIIILLVYTYNLKCLILKQTNNITKNIKK